MNAILGIIRDIFRMPVFRALGRLTFGAYLIHPVVARVMNGNIRSPIYVSRLRMVGTYIINALHSRAHTHKQVASTFI